MLAIELFIVFDKFNLLRSCQLTGSAPSSCGPCTDVVLGSPRTVNITINTANDTARFYTAGSGGSILIGFDATVTFSHPPANLTRGALVVEHGGCRHALVKLMCGSLTF